MSNTELITALEQLHTCVMIDFMALEGENWKKNGEKLWEIANAIRLVKKYVGEKENE